VIACDSQKLIAPAGWSSTSGEILVFSNTPLTMA
jgi:hypothetical protein